MSVIVSIPVDHEFGRLVLGENFITPKEIAKTGNLVYSDQEIEFFNQNIPSIDAMRWCKEHDFMVIAGPPHALSLAEVSDLPRPLGFRGGPLPRDEENFVRNEKVVARWHALRKPVRQFENVTVTLSSIEYVPTCVEVAWCITTYKAVRGIVPLCYEYARTSSTSSKGLVVTFGMYAGGGYMVTLGEDHDIPVNVIPAVRADLMLPWGKKE